LSLPLATTLPRASCARLSLTHLAEADVEHEGLAAVARRVKLGAVGQRACCFLLRCLAVPDKEQRAKSVK